MAEINITREDIERAKDYLPLDIKETMVRLMAPLCLEQVRNPNSSGARPLPDIVRESRKMRQQCLMGVFAQWYMGRKIEMQIASYVDNDGKTQEKPINYCMSADEYDKWAGSHVMNQMERWKRAKNTVSNKVYDIMYDFKAFENMLLGAIRDEIDARNDPALRMMQMMDAQASPETLRETLKVMQEAGEYLEERKNHD